MHSSRITETNLRARYAETDAMGVVYHANYLVWFEAGRGDHFRTLGHDYREWETLGLFLPVSEAYARYHAPARMEDLVTVQTWLEKLRSRSIKLGYKVVHDASGQTLCTGWTRHVCVDRKGQVRSLPNKMLHPLVET